MKSGRLFSISSVAVINFLGMVAGFFINSYLAYRFGAGFETDAYFIASMIPAFFVYLMGFDSLKGLARTLFIDITYGKRSEDLSTAFSNLFNVTFVAGIVVSLLAIMLSPVIVKFIAPGGSQETHRLAISLCRIMIPSVLMIGLANLNASILNMWNKFFFPSLGLFFQKVSIIVFLYLFCRIIGIYSAAIGMLVGSIISLITLFLPILLSGQIKYSFAFDLKSAILKDFLKLFSPLIFLLLVMQVNGAVIQFLGSFFQQGTITKLGYAKTVASVMIPVIVTPVLSVYLNDLCKCTSNDDNERVVSCYNAVYRVLILFLGFLILLQYSFPERIISILFQRGAFTATDVTVTTHYYLLFLAGIPFQAYGLLSNYLLLAAKRTDLILRVGLYTVSTNIVFSALLAWAFGPIGIVVGASAAWVVHAIVFHLQARKVVQRPLLAESTVWSFKVISILCVVFAGMVFLWHPLEIGALGANWDNIVNVALGGVVIALLFVTLSLFARVDEVCKVISRTRKFLTALL